MISRNLRWCIAGSPALVLAIFLCAMLFSASQDRPGLDRIPKRVMESLKARFPQAEIQKWTREEEGGTVIYDIEFTQEGRKFEADIKEDGTIHNWEKEIAAKDLPDVVRKAVERKYPKGVLIEIMAITAVTGGKETLERYEIIIQTADKRESEITVAPDGKIVEESGTR